MQVSTTFPALSSNTKKGGGMKKAAAAPKAFGKPMTKAMPKAFTKGKGGKKGC